MKIRLVNIFIAILCMALMLTGCGVNEEKVSDENKSKNKKELVIGELWEIDNVDPILDGTLVKEKALITETLTEIDENFKLVPSLAIEWKRLDKNLWEIKLRENVKFHDGNSLDAETVKWSISRALENNPSIQTLAKISNIKVVDPLTLQIETSEPNGDMAEILHYSNLSIIAKSSLDEKGNFKAPIGTGPFKYKNFDKSSGVLTMVRNDDYYGEKAKIEKLTIRPLPDPNTRALSIENGEIDFTCDPPLNDLKRLSEIKGLKLKTFTTPRVYIMKLNMSKGPLSDINVRKALSYGIDRKTIVEHALHNVGKAAKGPFSDDMAWVNKDLKGYPYDVEKAKKLLADSGYKDTDGDGILDKNGKLLELTFLTYPERPGLPVIAQALQGQYAEIGVKLNIEIMNNSAIKQRMDEGTWDISMSANATAMIPTPSYYLNNLYHSSNCTATGYSNPQMDKLLEACKATDNTEEKYEIAKQIQQLAEDELPIINIAQYGVGIVMKDGIQNFKFNPTAHDYMLNTDITIDNKE